MKTKKEIIAQLSKAHEATIAFDGQTDPEIVKTSRDGIVKHWEAQVAEYNEKHPAALIVVVVTDTTISAGTQTKFLPAYPRTGKLVVKSREYVVDGVHCAYVDILPQTYSESALHWGFQTKAGSTIIIQKD